MSQFFSAQSQVHLAGVTPDLVRVCSRALCLGSSIGFDFSVVDGLRTPLEADENRQKGVSQTTHSKHLPGPDGLSRAVDLCPYPVEKDGLKVDSPDWASVPDIFARWWVLRTLMFLAANEIGVKIRWGADWDSDMDVRDHKFLDAFHFEIV